MKGLGIFLICFVICVSFFQWYDKGYVNFDIKDYLTELQFEEMPELPNLSFDGEGSVENESNFWQKCAIFFTFVYECLCYPLAMIFWIFDIIATVTGGLVT